MSINNVVLKYTKKEVMRWLKRKAVLRVQQRVNPRGQRRAKRAANN
jgi:hypothetical protein